MFPEDNGSDSRARSETVVDEAEITISAMRFLSDANRLRLLRCLVRQEACVFELTEHLELPQSLVSYHLKRLRDAGVVRSQRRAHRVYYTIDPLTWDTFVQPIRQVCALIEEISEEISDDAPATPAAK